MGNSSKRTSSEGKVSWQNYGQNSQGENITTQMNVKDTSTGDHTWYKPLTGEQGVAVGTERQRDWR